LVTSTSFSAAATSRSTLVQVALNLLIGIRTLVMARRIK
jgi:hypothetical protein